ncbi:MAG: hypothetical protein AAF939_11595 [Planctomycetota bacterium]
MTATYDRLGIKFLYPENWKLIDEIDTDLPHVISLETPDGSTTWSVHVYPTDSDGDEIFKETLTTLMDTYEDCEVSKLKNEVGGHVAEGVDVLFYCLDFLIRAQIKLIQTEPYLIIVWQQAEDRDFDKQQMVFEAITISLLQAIQSDSGM